MKIIKSLFQGSDQQGVVSAHENVFVVKGIFRKRFYSLTVGGLVELNQYDLAEHINEKV